MTYYEDGRAEADRIGKGLVFLAIEMIRGIPDSLSRNFLLALLVLSSIGILLDLTILQTALILLSLYLAIIAAATILEEED